MTQSLLRATLGLLLAAGVTACSEIAGIHPTLNPAEEALSSPTLNISISKSRLGEEQKILHVLNRFGYGPRAGDVERIKKMGLVSYLRQQLSPGTIPDLYVERQLRDLPTLAMTTSQLLQDYESGKSLFRKSFHFYHPGAFLPGFFPSSDSVLVGVGSLFWVWGLAASKAGQNVILNVIRYLSCLDYKIQSEVFSAGDVLHG